MAFIEMAVYECTRCQKKYYGSKPLTCSCEIVLKEGVRIGAFLLQRKTEDRNWIVICQVCGLETVINGSNLKRQKSCGCKPRHIEVLGLSEVEMRYRCRKCSTTYTEELPILVWCCTDGI